MNAQSRRPPWLALLACLAAAGEVSAQVAPEDSATPAAAAPVPAAAPAAPAAAEPPVAGTGLKWRAAPVALSGWVSYDLRASRASDEPSSLSQLVTTSVTAQTYVYQPWFLTLGGTLALTVGRTRGGIEDGSPGERFVTGNARADFFPRSRFPFEVHVERSDSRIDSGLASSLDFRTQNFGFSQRYRPLSGAYNVSGTYDRREQSGTGFRDTQDLLAGDFGTRWKHHELSLGASYSQARRQASDERTQFSTLVGRHHYVPGSELSVSSTVNLTQTEENAAFGSSDLTVLQGSSVGLWHADGSKLSLTGSVRGLLLRDAVADHELDSLGATLGATYDLNTNARLSAIASANTTNSDGRRVLGVTGSVGASYQGDTIEFRGVRYDWFANGSVGGSRASEDTQTTLATQLGHTLNRSWPVTTRTTLGLSAAQTLSVSQNRSSHTEPGDPLSSSRTLLHTLGATWNTGGDNRSAYARATYSDSRELGGDNSRFQMFNFQLSGNFEFDRNRSLSGDLTFQRVAQRVGDTRLPGEVGLLLGERTSSGGVSGEIVYRHLRPFGIPRLRFTSRLKLAQDVLNQPGAFATIPDRETRMWENRLDWVAGRLESQLVFRISQIDGRRRDFLMWRVQRNFGG